jgi:hypothetical protein
MSVSFALIPVALALRAVMGKERFHEWVGSLQIKIPTTFRDEIDLLTTVRGAGYDADKWGGSYKTHIGGEKLWFFWEQVDGSWTAVFGTSDPRDDIWAFIRDVEAKAGRHIFEWEEDGQKPTVIQTRTFPTNFRDETLLRKTLSEYGVTPLAGDSGKLAWQINQTTLVFSQEDDQPFSLEVSNVTDMREVYSRLDDINEHYSRNVQLQTYQKLKDRIRSRGLVIQNEEVEQDESIVVTLTIG